MLDNQINAMLSDNGKYMMSYGDVSEDEPISSARKKSLRLLMSSLKALG